jgi:hypothetical protein
MRGERSIAGRSLIDTLSKHDPRDRPYKLGSASPTIGSSQCYWATLASFSCVLAVNNNQRLCFLSACDAFLRAWRTYGGIGV